MCLFLYNIVQFHITLSWQRTLMKIFNFLHENNQKAWLSLCWFLVDCSFTSSSAELVSLCLFFVGGMPICSCHVLQQLHSTILFLPNAKHSLAPKISPLHHSVNRFPLPLDGGSRLLASVHICVSPVAVCFLFTENDTLSISL